MIPYLPLLPLLLFTYIQSVLGARATEKQQTSHINVVAPGGALVNLVTPAIRVVPEQKTLMSLLHDFKNNIHELFRQPSAATVPKLLVPPLIVGAACTFLSKATTDLTTPPVPKILFQIVLQSLMQQYQQMSSNVFVTRLIVLVASLTPLASFQHSTLMLHNTFSNYYFHNMTTSSSFLSTRTSKQQKEYIMTALQHSHVIVRIVASAVMIEALAKTTWDVFFGLKQESMSVSTPSFAVTILPRLYQYTAMLLYAAIQLSHSHQQLWCIDSKSKALQSKWKEIATVFINHAKLIHERVSSTTLQAFHRKAFLESHWLSTLHQSRLFINVLLVTIVSLVLGQIFHNSHMMMLPIPRPTLGVYTGVTALAMASTLLIDNGIGWDHLQSRARTFFQQLCGQDTHFMVVGPWLEMLWYSVFNDDRIFVNPKLLRPYLCNDRQCQRSNQQHTTDTTWTLQSNKRRPLLFVPATQITITGVEKYIPAVVNLFEDDVRRLRQKKKNYMMDESNHSKMHISMLRQQPNEITTEIAFPRKKQRSIARGGGTLCYFGSIAAELVGLSSKNPSHQEHTI